MKLIEQKSELTTDISIFVPCLHHTNDHVNPQVNPKASNLFAFYHNNSNDIISSGFISKLFLEKCLWFRSLSYWPDPPGWIVWLSWSGNTQISLAVTYVQCLMSRNVNKIFFADLEILDLTNLTHCLTISQYQPPARKTGHRTSGSTREKRDIQFTL